MTRQEAIDIIRKENLKNYNLDEATSVGSYETVIRKKGNLWTVYSTDERAGIWGIEYLYNTEEEALDKFIFLLRLK